MEDNWENLAGALPGLSLSERSNAAPAQTNAPEVNGPPIGDVSKPPTPPPAECATAQTQQQNQHQAQPSAAAPEYEAVDSAIRQALADPAQRVTVLKCEELVEKYLADPCLEALQFPSSFTSYQRMLAHRVGQYYGLHTSTVDYEESQGRVVAVRSTFSDIPKPRLRNLDIRADPIAQRTSHANGMGGAASDRPRLLRRQDDERSMLANSELSVNQSPVRTMKERHENYMRAREELGLGNGQHDGSGGGRGGRVGPGGRFGPGGRMDGGRGRKAMFRDKDKELSDPDYRRGMGRFNGTARFDPAYAAMPAGGMYQVPTYASEFPALGRMPHSIPGRHMPPHPGQSPHQMSGGPQSHAMSGASPQQTHGGPTGQWAQQQQPQAPGGARPPPPPPPPHHHAGAPGGGPGAATAGGGSSMGGGGKSAHHGGGGGSGTAGGMGGGRQHQHQQAYGPAAMAASPYTSVGAQYPVPVASFMPAPPGQALYGMAAAGGGIPGAMYAAPAPGVGSAFYPGVGMGMGMGAVGMAVPAAGAYGYVAAPAPGVGLSVGSAGEAIALAPQGAYPVYASYPAGAAMYPAAAAAAAQMSPSAMHPAGGAAIPMRPMYGVPAFYPPYDPSQYATGAAGGMQAGGQNDARIYGSSYGNHHGGHHGQQHHYHGGHGGAGAGGGHQQYSSGGSHGPAGGAHGSGGRGRDSEGGTTRGDQHQSASAPSAPAAAGGGASGPAPSAGAPSSDAK